MDKISEGERLVKLMLFIKESGPVSFGDIRSRFPVEYSSKTGNDESVRRRFERDKRSLQELGIYLKVDEDKRYSLDHTLSYAAPVDLTPSQESLIRLVCGALLEDEDYQFKGDLRMVLVKLGDELGIPDLLPQMESPSNTPRKGAANTRGLDKVRKSITSRKRLSFDYVGASGKNSSREVEPFGCFILKGVCYVVAFDQAADGERCFRLDRMNNIRVNSAKPDIPDFEERLFDAEKYYGLPFQFGDEEFTTRIRFDENSSWRCERLIMGQGTIEEDGEGIIWSVNCCNTQALVRWCIEQAPGITIVDPPHARRAYREGISAALGALKGSEHEEAQ